MLLKFSNDIIVAIRKALDNELLGQRGSNGLAALNTLALSPELALDEEIQHLLIKTLCHRSLGYRRAASIILHNIGNPLGILHSTYNSLCIHPELHLDQSSISGWNDIQILCNSNALTEECIDLLLTDLQNPLAFRHCDVLAALPDEKIVSRALDLLDKPKPLSGRAAYILAMKNRTEGKNILQRLAFRNEQLGLAVVGLSHIPEPESVNILESLINKLNQCHALLPDIKEQLISEIKLRLPLVESYNSAVAMDIMKKHYFKEIKSKLDLHGVYFPDDFDAQLFLISSSWQGTSAPDFISEYLQTEDRTTCAEIQRAGMNQVVRLGLSYYYLGHWPNFMHHIARYGARSCLTKLYLEGVSVSYTDDDYYSAGIDWIKQAEKYRLGTLHRFLPN